MTENYNLRLANFLLRTERDEIVLMRDIKDLKLKIKERRSSDKKEPKKLKKRRMWVKKSLMQFYLIYQKISNI